MIKIKNFEKAESCQLSAYGFPSAQTRGRRKKEEPCCVRTEFQRDRDRIIHSKAFRRLKHKTQVFISPEGDHFRTRLTHTLEVSQIARTIARALRLNEDLVEAIALGHDLGHTPFGHAGEEALDSVHAEGFKHNEQSLRVVDELEHENGLNLTWEVRDGIVNHTGEIKPATLEGQIVKTADRIAYINHDIDDAIRAEIISLDSLPKEALKVLGRQHRDRINVMVCDMIQSSWMQPAISMSKEVSEAMHELREFLFTNVYVGSSAKVEEKKIIRLVKEIYFYYSENPDRLPNEYSCQLSSGTEIKRLVVDYIAGMTDRYAISVYKKLFIPAGFHQKK